MRWWIWILVVSAFCLPFIFDYYGKRKSEIETDKRKGCTCSKRGFGNYDFDCPVHNPFYIRYYKTVDNRISSDIIHASFGPQEPVCDECLNEIKPKGYIINWPQEPGICRVCGMGKEFTQSLPIRDLNAWQRKELVGEKD